MLKRSQAHTSARASLSVWLYLLSTSVRPLEALSNNPPLNPLQVNQHCT